MGVLREARGREGGYPISIKEKNGEGPIPLSTEGPGFTPLPGPFFVPEGNLPMMSPPGFTGGDIIGGTRQRIPGNLSHGKK